MSSPLNRLLVQENTSITILEGPILQDNGTSPEGVPMKEVILNNISSSENFSSFPIYNHDGSQYISLSRDSPVKIHNTASKEILVEVPVTDAQVSLFISI